jgi:hypothetical protein
MSDAYGVSASAPTGAPQDAVSVLQNISRQIGVYAQAIANAYPIATTTVSPSALGFNNISTTATVILPASLGRHGLLFHNPGTTTVYVFPTAIATSPTTAILGGTIVIYPGSTLTFSPTMFPNLTGGWSAFCGTGSSQPFTIIEFY